MATGTVSRDQILRDRATIAAQVEELSHPDKRRIEALAKAEAELAASNERLEAIRAGELAAAIAPRQAVLDTSLIARAKAFEAFLVTEAAVQKAALDLESVSGKPEEGYVGMFGLGSFLGALAAQPFDPAGFPEAGLKIVSKPFDRIAVEKII